MAVVGLDEFSRWDCVLDSIGLLIDPTIDTLYRTPYKVDAPDIIVEQQNQSAELDQNRLDSLYWGSNRSWHEGAGQQRLSMPSASSPYQFLSSKGIDITNKGKASLLHRTSKVLSLTNQGPLVPQRMIATDAYVYVADGQPNVKRFSALDASDAVDQSTATTGAKEIQDMATDGAIVYLALSSDGIHQSVLPGTTQKEAFDSGAATDSGANITHSYDTADKKEGTGSLSIVDSTGAGGNVIKNFGAAQDFSTVTQFKLWLKINRAAAAGAVKVRLQTSVGNYYERSVPAMANATWVEDTSNRTSDWVATGAPNWASIASIVIVVPVGAVPAYRSSASAFARATNSVTATVNAPAGLQQGDLLMMSISMVNASTIPLGDGPAPTLPAGWTVERNTANHGRHVTAWKIAGSSEPSTYDVSGSFGQFNIGEITVNIAAYSGVDNTSPINISGDATGSSATPTAPSVTTTLASCMIVTNFFQSTTGATAPSITPAAGMAERIETNRNVSGDRQALEMSDVAQAAAGASGSKAASSPANDTWSGHTIALAASAPLATVKADDFRQVIAGAFAHWSDWDARVLGWAKGSVYAAGVKAGTQWRFFLGASGATSQEIFVLPDGWVVTDIVELSGFIYFSAYRGTTGVIYAYDGTNAPFIALQSDALAAGDIPLSLGPFYGSGLLVGCRRPSVTASGGLGVLYRSFPAPDGHISAEELHTIGTQDDGKDYGIKCAKQIGKYVHYGYSFADATSAGLGIYLPESGGFTRHLDGDVSGPVADVVMFKGRRIFSIDGTGVYVEQATYVDSGNIISSIIDANVAADKVWLAEEVDYDLKSTGGSLSMEYSLDGGVTWAGLQTTPTQQAVARLQVPLSVKSPSIQYRVTVTSSSTHTISPDLFFAGIGGWPATKPHLIHTMNLRAFATEELRTGERLDDKDRAWTLLNSLLTRWATGGVYDYQPPWYATSQASVKVRIAQVTPWNGWGMTGDRQGGNIELTLKEV